VVDVTLVEDGSKTIVEVEL